MHLVISNKKDFRSIFDIFMYFSQVNLKIMKLITSNGIILPMASRVFVAFCVIFTVSIVLIVMRNNVYEFFFDTKIIWHTFFVQIIFWWLKSFYFQNLWELVNQKNKVDRLETYGIKHSKNWFQCYTILKILILIKNFYWLIYENLDDKNYSIEIKNFYWKNLALVYV